MGHPTRRQPLISHRRREDPLVGWRYWHLAPDGPVLRSVAQRRFQWLPGRALRASCISGGHVSPAEACNCGIYAARDLEALRATRMCLGPAPLVVGEVALWGRVASDETSHRGEYAYPRTLMVVGETAPEASRSAVVEALVPYGVPVSVASLHEVVGDVSAATMAFQAMSLRAGR